MGTFDNCFVGLQKDMKRNLKELKKSSKVKPIIKKYNSKDLNIAFNDGYETAKKEQEAKHKLFTNKFKEEDYNDILIDKVFKEWNKTSRCEEDYSEEELIEFCIEIIKENIDKLSSEVFGGSDGI